MKTKILAGCILTSFLGLISSNMAAADTFATSFTKLSGITGGSPAATAVYRADLSGLVSSGIQSLTITDNSGNLGGSPGQFSGFDLDAVMLSASFFDDAALINTLSALDVFDFAGGSIFTPGSQRIPTNPKLFGTNSSGNGVDNTVATLGSFDGNSTTVIPGAFGFLSMGDSGILSLNLTSVVNLSTLYLYIGEVGDNGEVAASNITVSDVRINPVPEPATLLIIGSGVIMLFAYRKKISI